ncbi:MAG: glutathione S-transferase family protein [Sphingomonadaceae bacterium]|nr:glutathione S-transferase family protein [Sphingomonadaceae bacterium]
MDIYGDRISGNCLKVKWVAEHLGIAFAWHDVNVVTGATRTPALLALNPAGKVPFVVLPGGETLSESNAIIHHLAEGSALIPVDPLARARMLQWMFWEQYSHEPYVAVCRFQLRYLGHSAADLDPRLVERGHAALALMEATLAQRRFFAGDAVSLADVALVAYTRVAHEGGFDLAGYPKVRGWIGRAEQAIGIRD